MSVCPSFVLVRSGAAPLCGRACAVRVINPQPVSWTTAIPKPNKDRLRARRRACSHGPFQDVQTCAGRALQIAAKCLLCVPITQMITVSVQWIAFNAFQSHACNLDDEHACVDVGKRLIGCALQCVCMCLHMSIFLPLALRGWVIDRTPKLFHVPATKLHYRAGLLQHSLTASQWDKVVFCGPILLTVFCAVTKFNDHHYTK